MRGISGAGPVATRICHRRMTGGSLDGYRRVAVGRLAAGDERNRSNASRVSASCGRAAGR
ncbi:hypothetical protein XAC3810_320143 [Xanthomonas citri pv. citri]|uniref:Uncharacterized protein n=1 Tax=Xanthomonas citri pv. citri TaxID=611301 RepID=A0A0U5BTV6_XANCI|nr:hypothetical protein XAC3824_390002 [Xanthomonas citri pv. citri]CEJ43693.1 hypothetical protein XAB3213_2160002 [Xanthomonas citri pv. bilvae]CEE27088.1 hypothetical protein XAC1083_360123 [Xanthomonas citri pv. citri]CEE35708.1 hypothetical protein XAC3810_320143 [Xanthomonas citri pv. citri]CEE38196.1 hypothetical protein XAC902_480138 [Xanthomonas citri pv. citri]